MLVERASIRVELVNNEMLLAALAVIGVDLVAVRAHASF